MGGGQTGQNECLRLRSEGLEWRVADEQLIILDLQSSTYVTVNRSARVLWERLELGATVEELAGSLLERYGISAEQADADARSFVEDLQGRGMLA